MHKMVRKITAIMSAAVLCLSMCGNVMAAENVARGHIHSYGENYYRTEQGGSYTHKVAVGIIESTHEVVYRTCTVIVEYEYYMRKCTYPGCNDRTSDRVKETQTHSIDANTEWWLDN